MRHAPGHRPHHIQVRLSAEARTREDVVVMDADRESAVVAAGDDELLRIRTHDGPRLAALIHRHGPRAQLDRRHNLLRIDLHGRGHRAVFSIQLPGEAPTACSPADG